MTRRVSIHLMMVALLLAPLAAMAGDLTPERLRCEYRVDPVGIDDPSPRLDWIVTSEENGQFQTAYRILVASSRQKLGQGIGDLWDTGKVTSDRTTQIAYRGEPLSPGRRCFWKVMVYDANGLASRWSENATFSAGMMGSDWGADWIGRDAPHLEKHDIHLRTPPPLPLDLGIKLPGPQGIKKLARGAVKVYLPPPYLRKEFAAGPGIERATVYATALGLYELRLNGERVGDDYFTPGWTEYDKRVYYQAYDVTDMVRPGQNAIGAILSDGWYAGNIGLKRQRYYGDKLRFRARLEIEYEDGSSDIVVTDDTWRASRGPIGEADIQYGEHYDARKEIPGWDRPGHEGGEWKSVDVTKNVVPVVESYPGIPVRKTKEIRPVSVKEPRPGVFVFNMGQNFAGWARLEVRGNAGDKVTMRFGEMLNADGTVYTKNLRSARATDVYILKGEGVETWEPRFTYHGFQYVELLGYPGEPDIGAVTGIVAHSDLPLAGSLETSDPLVNKLYSNIVWGQRSNYFEVPTDCPQRDERLGWTGDAQIFIRAASYNMDIAPFFTKWMVDLEDGQDKRGRFPDVAPNVLPGAAAGWGDAGVICPHTIYMVYGDKRILEKHYDAMSDFMEFMYSRSRNGISPPLGFYGDWVNIDDPTPLDVVATAYHAHDCSLMAEAARAIGKSGDARMYGERFDEVAAAFSSTFVGEDGRVKGDSQTAYLLALGFDLLPESKRQPAAERLVGKIEENDYCLSTGFLGLKMLLPVLSEIGENELAYRLLVNRDYPSWGYSIDQGATTVWERWNSYTIEDGFGPVSMNSFNHYAFGSVGEWMFRTMAGIDTDGPGYKKIVIRPRPGGDMARVKARYDSIRGTIASEWRIEDGRFKLDVTIPANTTATVHLPGRDPMEIGSGTYSFSAPIGSSE